jgi:hypothetical protein
MAALNNTRKTPGGQIKIRCVSTLAADANRADDPVAVGEGLPARAALNFEQSLN